MSWKQYPENFQPDKDTDCVLVSTRKTAGEKHLMCITFSPIAAERLGLKAGQKVDVYLGERNDTGLLRIQPSKTGPKKIGNRPGRGDNGLLLLISSEWAGVSFSHKPTEVEANGGDMGIIIVLPSWARAKTKAVA